MKKCLSTSFSFLMTVLLERNVSVPADWVGRVQKMRVLKEDMKVVVGHLRECKITRFVVCCRG